jgi:hypothetical protein
MRSILFLIGICLGGVLMAEVENRPRHMPTRLYFSATEPDPDEALGGIFRTKKAAVVETAEGVNEQLVHMEQKVRVWYFDVGAIREVRIPLR